MGTCARDGELVAGDGDVRRKVAGDACSGLDLIYTSSVKK